MVQKLTLDSKETRRKTGALPRNAQHMSNRDGWKQKMKARLAGDNGRMTLPSEEQQATNIPRQKVVETPIFIPFTKGSILQKEMQQHDNILGEAMNAPGVRFVERCDPTIIDTLS